MIARALGLVLLLSAHSWAAKWPDLPDIPAESTYTIRVLYLEDPALPGLTLAERVRLYGEVSELVLRWYGYRITLEESAHGELRSAFGAFARRLAPARRAELDRAEVDPFSSSAESAVRAFVRSNAAAHSLEELRRYLGGTPEDDRREIEERATGALLSRLRSIQRELNGPAPTVFRRRTSSFMWWNEYVTGLSGADFVLTNGVIAAADPEMPLYVIARGGVTTGFVNRNDRSQFALTGVVGALPFLSRSESFAQEGGSFESADERRAALSTFWLHELGHFLPRVAERYDHAGCVHVAPPRLDAYRLWFLEVRRAGPCPLKHGRLNRDGEL